MYVQDMTLQDALEWEESILSLLEGACGAQAQQLRWDLRDVRSHIAYLTDHATEEPDEE